MRITRVLKINSLIISFFIFFSLGAIVHAETIYVDNTTTGCSKNPDYNYNPATDTCGSGSYRVYKEPQDAADIADPGDVVIVADGIYTDKNGDNFVIYIRRSGTSANWITLKAETKWGAVLDGENYTTYGGIRMQEDPAPTYYRIEDFEITETEWGGIGVRQSSNVYIYRNHIHDIGRKCVYKSGISGFGSGKYSYNITFDSNLVHHIGRLHPSDGCDYSNGDYQQSDHGMYSRGSINIINNLFYENNSGWAISLRGSNTNVINNTFADPNRYRGGLIEIARDYGHPDNVVIQNNIVYGDSGEDFILPMEPLYGYNIDIKNNLLITGMNIIGDWYCDHAGRCYKDRMYNILNNKFGNPIFENASNRDYHIRSTSPAKNTGYAPGAPALDHDGNTRDSQPDIGAHEYVGNTPPPTPDPPDLPGDKLINIRDTWRYYKGYSTPAAGWNAVSFDDSSWLQGASGIGFGDSDDATVLSDMQNNYLTVYTRKSFTIDDRSLITGLTLGIDYDDGFVAYLNGEEVARAGMPSGTPTYNTQALGHEAGTSESFSLNSYISKLRDGVNVLAVEIHNKDIYSSDLSLITELSAASDGQTNVAVGFVPAPPTGIKVMLQ